MGAAIIDARSFKFLPEALEACVIPHDLVITDDIGVAVFTIKKGASAIDHRGRLFDARTIEQDLSKRDRERLLRSMEIFPPCQNEPAPNSADARRLASVIEAFASPATPCEPRASRYDRILVDADNLPTTRILPAARSLGIPVLVFHDETSSIGTRLFQTDPTSQDESANGFWVEQISVPSGKHAVDLVMIERAQIGDFVLTNDGPLTYKCLEIGCAVMSKHGAFHEPEEYPYFPTENAFRQSRQIRSNAIKQGLNKNERAIEFMKRLHSALCQ